MRSKKYSALYLTAALGCGIFVPARALDVAGNVLDKVGLPINQAKVCIQAEPAKCVNTNTEGRFRITSVNSIRGTLPSGGTISMAYRNGALTVHAATATAARLQWLAADGRRPLAVQNLHLAQGRNILALPGGLPRSGVILLRLTTPDRSLAWKAVLASGRPAEGGFSAQPRIAALTKASGANTLIISKAGYKTKTYEPYSDPEDDALIFLAAEGDNGLPFDGTYTAKVIAIDRTAKTIITETVDWECDEDDKVVRDTSRDTTSYVIRDGKMYVWVKGDCVGQIFTGAATDPVGTWTLAEAESALPADLAAGCVPDSGGGEEIPFENFSATYTITETAITGKIKVDICAADLYGPLLLILFGDTSIAVTKNTCKQVVLKNGKGESATIDFSKEKDSLHIGFTYKTTVCAGNEDLALSDREPACPEAGGLMGLVLCMAGSGFSENVGGVEKTSAAPVSRERFAAWKPLPMSREPFRIPVKARLPAARPRGLSIFPWHGAR